MSRTFVWCGWIFFMSVPWADEITGKTFSSADTAEGYAAAIGLMVFGIGIHVMHRP